MTRSNDLWNDDISGKTDEHCRREWAEIAELNVWDFYLQFKKKKDSIRIGRFFL